MPRANARTGDALKLDAPCWGLADAKYAAAKVLSEPALLKPLLRALFSANPALRHHASDAARRIAEKQTGLLSPHTERLLGLFSDSENDNWRTRAHLGLVVARVAQTRPQRLRAAGLLVPLYYDPRNVVRCTAVEGLGLLAQSEPNLRTQVQPLLEEAVATGTLAMQCRARYALARFAGPR